jgi:hypothetical protein
MPYAPSREDAPLVRVSHTKEHALATPNYGYEKRQRELAKKRKAEEKRMKKLQGGPADGDDAPPPDGAPADAAPQADTPPPAGVA